jgi:hypothetical protein
MPRIWEPKSGRQTRCGQHLKIKSSTLKSIQRHLLPPPLLAFDLSVKRNLLTQHVQMVPPEPDGSLKSVTRVKILHYHQIYLNRPDQITVMSVTVDTSVRIYDDFSRLLFLHTHREVSICSG